MPAADSAEGRCCVLRFGIQQFPIFFVDFGEEVSDFATPYLVRLFSPQQLSHLAPTYATVMALVTIGSPAALVRPFLLWFLYMLL